MHLRLGNVNEAFPTLVKQLALYGVETNSRAGRVLQLLEPVMITYERPWQRVLLNKARDANPFFHLYESLWMLAGRNDVAPLSHYNSRIADIASDDGITFNGAYGYRWRSGSGWIDQLERIVGHLQVNPESRRAVLSMWDVEEDLDKADWTKDVCCNTHVYFAINPEWEALDMMVCNRSNDLIWGMLGANVVHFSFLQEYMAARIGVGMGKYTHVTNNLHVYKDNWKPKKWLLEYERDMLSDPVEPGGLYEASEHVPLVSDPYNFVRECKEFVCYHSTDSLQNNPLCNDTFLRTVADPMCRAFHAYKAKDFKGAEGWLSRVAASDWRVAGQWWIEKRRKRYEETC